MCVEPEPDDPELLEEESLLLVAEAVYVAMGAPNEAMHSTVQFSTPLLKSELEKYILTLHAVVVTAASQLMLPDP